MKVDKEGKVEIPVYYFPGWEVFVDNEIVPLSYDNSLGLITISVPVGSHEVKAKLSSTPVRSLGNFLSLISWFFFFFFLFKKSRQEK
ncbi:MAG: hypothetical protein M1514_02635 [Patescibacteria group bacterium]|nr:hypothetical protein [Patescibacteria group bacterium]